MSNKHQKRKKLFILNKLLGNPEEETVDIVVDCQPDLSEVEEVPSIDAVFSVTEDVEPVPIKKSTKKGSKK